MLTLHWFLSNCNQKAISAGPDHWGRHQVSALGLKMGLVFFARAWTFTLPILKIRKIREIVCRWKTKHISVEICKIFKHVLNFGKCTNDGQS